MHMFEQGTPAEHMLGIIQDVLLGNTPTLPSIMAVRTALMKTADVYRPLVSDLQERIAATHMDVSEAACMELGWRRSLAHPASGGL